MPELWMNPEWRPPSSVRTSIVFVHGAIVNGWEMGLLRHRLSQVGYEVSLFQYHSMLCGLEENARLLAEFVAQTEGDVVHVVGHSMGGILIRHAFEKFPDPRPGRLVAIGSPFLDCWVAHRYARAKSYLGIQLVGRTVQDHIHQPRDPVWRGARELGILAGTYPLGIGIIFHDLPRKNDGIVLWDETRLQGARDHVTYRINHFGLLLSKRCAAQIARFLALGAFAHPAPSPEIGRIVEETTLV